MKILRKIVALLCFLSLSTVVEAASPPPPASTWDKILTRIVFEQPDNEVVCENGLKIVFVKPIANFDVDLYAKEPNNNYISVGNGYFGASGVIVELTNTSNDVMVVKWNQSQFRIGTHKGLPFLSGMKYKDAGNPSAIRDTIIAPGETVLEDLYTSSVEFKNGYWNTGLAYLSPSYTTNAGVYMKVEKNGASSYFGKVSPNIIIK